MYMYGVVWGDGCAFWWAVFLYFFFISFFWGLLILCLIIPFMKDGYACMCS
jgi:hypothetical protein